MAEDLGERTEQPTGRRLSDARERGQVAKSQDLTAATDLITAVVMIAAGGGAALAVFAGMMRRVLEGQTAGGWLDASSIRTMVGWVALQGAKVMVPALLIRVSVGLLGQIVRGAWHVWGEPLAPKLTRLNPFAGVGK